MLKCWNKVRENGSLIVIPEVAMGYGVALENVCVFAVLMELSWKKNEKKIIFYFTHIVDCTNNYFLVPMKPCMNVDLWIFESLN